MSPNITPEEIELIKSAKAGSESAFTQLFKNYKSFVDNLLYLYIKDKDEARDITNVVFLKVHEKLSKFTDYQSFGGWLRILTKNVAIDYLRTVKESTAIDEGNAGYCPDSSVYDTEKSYIDKMTYDNLIDLFEILPPSYRDVCRLFYVDNMTVAQIAQALHMPKGTIKSDLHRMRKLFQKHLKL